MNATDLVPVAAVVVSFDTRELTLRAVHAALRGTRVPAEIVVVDNASRDGSADAIRARFGDRVMVIGNATNVGFARANNQGIAATRSPYLWLLNSDTEAGNGTLEAAYVFMESHQHVAAGTPPLVYPDGRPQPCGGFFPSFSNIFFRFVPIHRALSISLRSWLRLMAVHPREIPPAGKTLDYATGASLFLRRDAFLFSGGFDERYFMYFEETDLCHRLREAGYRVVAFPADAVMHVGGGSFRRGFDPAREAMFVSGLCAFVSRRYAGLHRSFLLAEVAVLAPLHRLLRRFF